MPIHEYQCKECGHIAEVFKRITEKREDSLKCEECGGDAVKIWSTTGKPKLLGKGFHQNDYP